MSRSLIFIFILLALILPLTAQEKVSVQMLDRIDSLIKHKLQEGSTDSLSSLYLSRANAKLSLFSEIGEALYDLQTAATYARYN